jgi:hypothetical protein
MAYTLLRQGDHLPAVGVLQKLLNARVGTSLVADGIYGSKTRSAVQEFQRPRGLTPDGVVGAKTWPRLTAHTSRLEIMDCVDVFDPSLWELETQDIRLAGGNPLLIGGMSNGVEQMVTQILQAAPHGRVFILRFHGHGAAGVAGISEGHGGHEGEHLSGIHGGNWDRVRDILRQLRPVFGPYGCIQFMHCSTGHGPSGRQLLSRIANEIRVPTTAALRTQYGGGTSTFRFEGPTHTAVPDGQPLRAWCVSRPEFAAMSVV